MDEVGLENLEYNKPGNMSKYIEIKQGDQTNRMTWSDEDQNETTEKLEKIYQLLQALITD